MTPGHCYELVQDLALLLLGGLLVAPAERSENFVLRNLADRVLHRVPPDVGNNPLRQRYAFGNKINESMRWGKIIDALHYWMRPSFSLLGRQLLGVSDSSMRRKEPSATYP